MLLHPLLCWISEFCPRVSIWESHTSWSKWLPCPCGKLHETLLNTTCDQFLLTVKTTENTSFLLQVTIFHKKLQGEGHGFPNPFVLDDSLVAWNMEFQGDGQRLFHAARRFFLCWNSTKGRDLPMPRWILVDFAIELCKRNGWFFGWFTDTFGLLLIVFS